MRPRSCNARARVRNLLVLAMLGLGTAPAHAWGGRSSFDRIFEPYYGNTYPVGSGQRFYRPPPGRPTQSVNPVRTPRVPNPPRYRLQNLVDRVLGRPTRW